MSRKSLLTIIVSLSLSTTVIAGSYKIVSYASKRQYSVEITAHALERTPPWAKDADNPPVSARKAISLATQMRRTLVADDADCTWSVANLTLQFDENDRWFWIVHFKPTREGWVTDETERLKLVVLMDETVLKPTCKEMR